MFVERYSHVMHIVSAIEGKLRPELTAVDALRACFPAGTLSGAPGKVVGDGDHRGTGTCTAWNLRGRGALRRLLRAISIRMHCHSFTAGQGWQGEFVQAGAGIVGRFRAGAGVQRVAQQGVQAVIRAIEQAAEL